MVFDIDTHVGGLLLKSELGTRHQLMARVIVHLQRLAQEVGIGQLLVVSLNEALLLWKLIDSSGARR